MKLVQSRSAAVSAIALLALSSLTCAATLINTIPGTRGARIVGQGSADGLAYSSGMTAIGDINSDGKADLAVPAPGTPRGATLGVGAVHIFFGRNGALSNLDVSNIAAGTGFSITGSTAAASTSLGAWTAGVGDVNNDNADDFLIGTSSGVINTGRVYLIFGKPVGQSFTATLDVNNLGTNGVEFIGANVSDFFGSTPYSGSGDVSGDGLDDFVLGAQGDNGRIGASYLVFGRTSWPSSINVGSAPSTSLVKLTGEAAADQFGVATAIIPDINNDGRADLLANAFAADVMVNGDEGKAYVLFGRPSSSPWTNFGVGALNGSDGFQIRGAVALGGFGAPALGIGDFNGDSLNDLAVSAVTSAGTVGVFFGKANWDAVNTLAGLTGNNGARFNGGAAGDAAGAYLAAPGDVNGDGFADLITSAPGADAVGASNSGKIYVLYGKSTAFAADTALSSIDGTAAGEVFQGATAGFGAGPIASVGKFSDADTLPDFLIGSETAQGDAYLVTGSGSTELFRNGFE